MATQTKILGGSVVRLAVALVGRVLSAMRAGLPLFMGGTVALLSTGCVGVVPIPVYSSTPEYGQKLKPSQTRFIRPGQTTRAEVISRLGTNCVSFRRTRSIAYTWEMRGGGGAWWVCSFNGAAGGDWVGGWRGFLVAFDDQDVVRAAEFKMLSTRRPLDENMDHWVAKLPPAIPSRLIASQ